MDGMWDIDEAAWSRLRQVVGDKLTVELIDIFLRHTAQVLAEAREACGVGNLEPVQRAGHSLKSNCGHLGALAMREVAIRLERAAAAQQTEIIPATLLELENAFVCVSAQLKEKRRTMAA